MSNLSGFNANNHQELESFDFLPNGDYIGKIVESEEIKNNAGTGSYLKLKFEITDGKYAKRFLWTNLNLDHPNQDAVEIANRHLAAICKAVGIIAPEDSEELHGTEIVLKVIKKKTTNPDYPESNEIKGYKSLPDVESPNNTGLNNDPVDIKKSSSRRVSFD